MAGERKYTRIPPESTGDRVYMIHTAEINYNNKDTGHTWQIGERYRISGNSGNDFIIHLHGVFEATSTTGRLAVHYNQEAKEQGWLAESGQSIQYDTDNDGVQDDVVATVSADAYDLYIPAQNIMGYDNPEYGWDINRFGSGLVTFQEGNPQVTGMGTLRVNDAALLASYDFSKSSLQNEFVNSREGGSDVSSSWDEATRSVKLVVGTTSGDRVTQTSNLFHSYEEGANLLFIMSARSGDAGKEFVARNWGAFDATDGFFFQIKGSDDAPGGRTTPTDPVGTGPGSALRVVHRFTFNGVTNNHEILQKEWNSDTLLGTGGALNPSGKTLDVTKVNTYWIDYQFVGGGRTRWGVFFEGERIVCHEMFHHNGIGVGTQFSNPLSNPSRPVCWAIVNYGTSGSSSEFYALGAGVLNETVTDPLKAAPQISIDVQTKMWGAPETQPYWRTKQTLDGSSSSFPALLKSGSYSSSSSTQYAMSLSPDQFLLKPDGTEGDENHSIYQPLLFDLNNHKISNGDGDLAEVRSFYGCIVRGFEFNDARPSTPTVAYDRDGDHLAHVIQIGRYVIDGKGEFDFSKLTDNFQYGTVRNLSDQKFSRALQPLTTWTSTDDRYVTGNSRVVVGVGPNPVYGSSIHYFADKQPVVIREVDGDQDVATVLGTTYTGLTAGGSGYASKDKVDNPNDWYYLSYVDRNEGWLYSTQADIDDDRLTRVLTVDDCSSTDLGQVISVGASTAYIMKINVNDSNADSAGSIDGTSEYQILTKGSTDYTTVGAPNNYPGTIFTSTGTLSLGQTGTVVLTSNSGNIAICGRSDSSGDYVGAFTTHADSAGGPTLGSGTVSAVTTDATIAKDYWTSINALQYNTDLGLGSDVDLSNTTGPTYTGLALYGNPNPRAAWTFMIKHLDNANEDEDGDAGPVYENTRNNWNVFWRERTQ